MTFKFRMKKSISKSTWGWIALAVVIVGLGVYAYLAQIGKVQRPNWWQGITSTSSQSQQVTTSPASSSQISKISTTPENQERNLSVITKKTKEGEKILPKLEATTTLPGQEKNGYYQEVAAPGDGITNLARRAVKQYLSEHQADYKVTPQHKVYIEDYIQKHLGSRWLKLGEKMNISKSLIEQAIGAAKNLTPSQLENLTQYSSLVPSLNY